MYIECKADGLNEPRIEPSTHYILLLSNRSVNPDAVLELTLWTDPSTKDLNLPAAVS
jgi:hypothetical protein